MAAGIYFSLHVAMLYLIRIIFTAIILYLGLLGCSGGKSVIVNDPDGTPIAGAKQSVYRFGQVVQIALRFTHPLAPSLCGRGDRALVSLAARRR